MLQVAHLPLLSHVVAASWIDLGHICVEVLLYFNRGFSITLHTRWILTFVHWGCVLCLWLPLVLLALVLCSQWTHMLPSWVTAFVSPWISVGVVLCPFSFSFFPILFSWSLRQGPMELLLPPILVMLWVECCLPSQAHRGGVCVTVLPYYSVGTLVHLDLELYSLFFPMCRWQYLDLCVCWVLPSLSCLWPAWAHPVMFVSR